MPKISVIVPVYNSELYLCDCLNSLVNQTIIDDMEIIIVDDCSTDNSFKIATSFANYYPQIKLIKNEINLGTSRTRNFGIWLAEGEYIGFIDSDDFITPTMYEQMYKEAIAHEYPEVVNTGIKVVEEFSEPSKYINNQVVKPSRLISIEDEKEVLFTLSPSCCNKMFRSDIIKKYTFLEDRMWEDYAFCYASLIRSEYLLKTNTLGYFYRQHSRNSVSSKAYTVNSQLLDMFPIADEISTDAKKNEVFDIYEEEIRLLQTTFCLCRINEILRWHVNTKDKVELAKDIDSLLCLKYGDWRKQNFNVIAQRINLYLINNLGITNHHPSNEDEPELIKKISRKLTQLK